jgi:NAD(P)-dependent dehydrogenase (short-subunit alcohol dehydrogenase family)
MTTFSEGALADRSVLVTGASSGIGRAIALAAAAAGADVALTYRVNAEGAGTERAIAALGRRAAVLQFDATDDRPSAPSVLQHAATGRIDVWVNSGRHPHLTTATPIQDKLDLLRSISAAPCRCGRRPRFSARSRTAASSST